jgi:hypothetical protein
MRAIQIGVPVLASDLPPVRELCLNPESLLEPGDEVSWRRALKVLLSERKVTQLFDSGKIPTVEEMTRKVLEVYQRCMPFKEKEVILC